MWPLERNKNAGNLVVRRNERPSSRRRGKKWCSKEQSAGEAWENLDAHERKAGCQGKGVNRESAKQESESVGVCHEFEHCVLLPTQCLQVLSSLIPKPLERWTIILKKRSLRIMTKASNHCPLLVSSTEPVNFRDMISHPKLSGSLPPSWVSHGSAGCCVGGFPAGHA